jgi:2-dehydropantoate 2-reductase
MRVAIVGAGAMGCLFTHLLSRTDSEIFLLDIHPERVEAIRSEGLFVEGVSGDHRLRPSIHLDPGEIGPVDLVLLCVKAPDTLNAARSASALLGRDTPVLTLQNGLGNLEAIEEALGPGRALGGTTSMGATVLSLNRIRHAGWGETVLGEPSGKRTARVEAILGLFEASGLKVAFTEDLRGLLWSKLIVNIGINALTALTGLHNGQIPLHAGSRRILEKAVEEAVRVASALGVRLLYSDPLQKVLSVCEATAANVSSMLQDVLKQKKTEVNQIQGALIREAARLGIPTPVNETLRDLVVTLEESYAKRVRTL